MPDVLLLAQAFYQNSDSEINGPLNRTGSWTIEDKGYGIPRVLNVTKRPKKNANDSNDGYF